MPIMLRRLDEALREAGATPSVAAAAAEEVAGYENRLAAVEIKLASLDVKVTMLQWMLGLNMAMTVAILFKVFS